MEQADVDGFLATQGHSNVCVLAASSTHVCVHGAAAALVYVDVYDSSYY